MLGLPRENMTQSCLSPMYTVVQVGKNNLVYVLPEGRISLKNYFRMDEVLNNYSIY